MNKSRLEIHWDSKSFLGFNLTSHKYSIIICVVWDTEEYKVNAFFSKNNLNEKIQNIKKS